MNVFERWLGDEVWPLICLLALVALGLAIAMAATGRGRFFIGVVALACLALLLVAIEYVWVTDRERVDGIVHEMADSAVREDASGLVQHLSPTVRYGTLDRSAIERLASATFEQFAIDRVTVSGRKTEVFAKQGEARVDFLAVVRGRRNNVDFSPYPTRWVLTFVKNPQGVWLVEDIEQVTAYGENRQPIAPQVP